MLTSAVFSRFETLIENTKSPIAVAFSGGGDSAALLALVMKWNGGVRPVHALIVDHSLRESSATEARLAAKRAAALGAHPDILTWRGAKPKSAIQEKARRARYKLMGAYCREHGINTLLLGHNSGDQAETVFMRAVRKSSYNSFLGMDDNVLAPLWPETYAVRIVRPLLGVSRADLRTYNTDNNIAYIDDPSNEDLQYERVRAREHFKTRPGLSQDMIVMGTDTRISFRKTQKKLFGIIDQAVTIYPWGGLSLPMEVVFKNHVLMAGWDEIYGSSPELLRTLGLAASGNGQGVGYRKYQKLVDTLISSEEKMATLGGAHYSAANNVLTIIRDPGHVLGRKGVAAMASVQLKAGQEIIWDGRFLIKTMDENVRVTPAALCVDRLTNPQKQLLKMMPLLARASQPVLQDIDGLTALPALENTMLGTCHFLANERFAALL